MYVCLIQASKHGWLDRVAWMVVVEGEGEGGGCRKICGGVR